jgi:hypothetical protein
MAQFDRKGGSTYTILMVLKDWNIQRAWVSTLLPDHDGEGTTGHQLCRTATCTRIEIKLKFFLLEMELVGETRDLGNRTLFYFSSLGVLTMRSTSMS